MPKKSNFFGLFVSTFCMTVSRKTQSMSFFLNKKNCTLLHLNLVKQIKKLQQSFCYAVYLEYSKAFHTVPFKNLVNNLAICTRDKGFSKAIEFWVFRSLSLSLSLSLSFSLSLSLSLSVSLSLSLSLSPSLSLSVCLFLPLSLCSLSLSLLFISFCLFTSPPFFFNV